MRLPLPMTLVTCGLLFACSSAETIPLNTSPKAKKTQAKDASTPVDASLIDAEPDGSDPPEAATPSAGTFINLGIGGVVMSTSDGFAHYAGGGGNCPASTFVNNADLSAFFEIKLAGGPGTYGCYFYSRMPSMDYYYTNSAYCTVVISQYGPVGSFVEGTISGVVRKQGEPGVVTYSLSGTFRAVREPNTACGAFAPPAEGQ